ncbi:MAG TPA: hypothetical protein VMU82_08865 [Acetobacteraceae bacterium]|nr:hypothetical protein [Acetobacteraceae bacterium]
MADDPSAMHQAAVANYRDTVKWLTAGFAGVGAVFVAGTSLASIGSATGWRLGVALAAAVGALACIGACLSLLLDLLAPNAVFADAARTDAALRAWIDSHADSLLPAEDGASVIACLDRLHRLREQMGPLWAIPAMPDPDAATAAALRFRDRLAGDYDALQPVVAQLAMYAESYRLRHDLARAKRPLFGFALGAAVLLGTFAWAANPPAHPKPAGPLVVINRAR